MNKPVSRRGGNMLAALQFLVVVLPVAALLFVQTLADSRRAHLIEQSRPLRVLSQDARVSYKTFLASVSDAVDTGSMSAAGLQALQQAGEQLETLARSGADPAVLHDVVPVVRDLGKQLQGSADLSALVKVRDTVRATDSLTRAISEEFDRRDAAVQQDAISSAERQQKQVLLGFLLTFAITATFLITSQIRLRRQQATDRLIVEGSERLRIALDSVSGIVILAGRDDSLIYLNAPGSAAFAAAQEDLAKLVQGFDAEHLEGLNTNALHAMAFPTVGLLSALTDTFRTNISIGKRAFRVIINPVRDAQGNRLGTVAEWLDVTQEQGIEHEVADIVAAAQRGDLSKRLQMAGKSGLWEQLAIGVNGIVDNLARIVKDVNVVVAAGKSGDLSPRMDLMGKAGAFAELSSGINSLMEKLSQDRGQEAAVEKEVFVIVEAAQRGDLSKRLDLAGKTGMWLQLATGINGMVDNLAAIVADVNAVVTAGTAGDLTPRIDVTGRSGAFAELSLGINGMMEDLMALVREIKQISDSVRLGADEISAGNLSLSRSTEERASGLEEMSSTMEEMTSAVRQSAGNATLANTLAAAARDQANNGSTVVNAAVAAMREIDGSSKRIEAIIGVIDEIAFQTNLLALNAAVEAARAGEQGRGFAVVATEVRNLAGRSATAAKEIKGLIRDSVQRVAEGSRLVDQSGETLGEIGAAVAKVTGVMADIAYSSQEQASGIEQVNKAVRQMDQVTQQNATLAQQAAAASQTIAGQANQLAVLVAHFRVGDAQTAAVSRASAGEAVQGRSGRARA